MKIHGFDHVEYYVEDLEKTTEGLCGRYGFCLVGRSAAGLTPRSVLLKHGQVKILVTAPGTTDDQVAAYLARHGDGIAMIAFATDDVRQTFDDIVAAGGKGLAAPTFAKSGHERVGTALVGGFGDVTHKLVERTNPDGEFAPGFIEMEPDAGEQATDELLSELDHVAVCLPAGELDRTVCFYRDVFGLAQIYDERIEVGTQAMLSKVVQDHDGLVTFTLIEPDTTLEPGQIDDFLESHGGAGVQHLAFRTTDIAAAVRTISDRGVEFLVAPGGYYQALEGRLGKLAIPLEVLRELNVLADRDRWGQMFQIFARSTHERRTLFFELIERQGALTFGTRNIRALYEALEDTRVEVAAEVSPSGLRSHWIGSKGATMTTTSQFTLTKAELDLLPTDAEVEHYRQHGWYLTRKLFSDAEIDALVEASDQFYAGHRDRTLPQRPPNLAYWEPSHGPVQRHNDYVHYESDALAAILRKPLVGAVAARLAETAQIRVFQATMIYKPPNPDEVTNLVPWHADRHYWQTCTSDQMLTAFIPFHDCGVQMGTITMIDGSHRWQDIPGDDSTRHFAQRDRSELEELLHKTAEYNGGSVKTIPMIIPKGHMSFHHCRIYHGSGHNKSSMPRRAISLHLQDGDNQWRPYQKADGTKVVYNNDVLVRTTLAGTPDYADPDYCPVTWQC